MIKQVTVYTTKKNVVLSHGEYVPQYKLAPIGISFQVGECFDKRSVEEIRLPIQKFRWCDGREIFAAFDEELLELIGCLQSQKDNELALSVKKRTKPLLQKINQYETMTIWQRIKFVFTNKLES